MFYLLLSVASSVAIAVIMRAVESDIKNSMCMFLFNYMVCAVLSFIYAGGTLMPKSGDGLGFALAFGAFTGVFYLLGFVCLKWNIGHNGMMLASTFQKLGLLIPTTMAITVFGEEPRLVQMLGLAFGIMAILVMNLQRNGGEEEQQDIRQGESNPKIYRLGLVVALIISGLGDSTANIYDKMGTSAYKNQFLFMIFVVAGLLSLILAIGNKQGFHMKDALCGAIIGVPNYYSARFLLLSLGELPAIIVYPFCNAAVVLVVTTLSMLIFKEKMTKRKGIAILLVILSLVLLSV